MILFLFRNLLSNSTKADFFHIVRFATTEILNKFYKWKDDKDTPSLIKEIESYCFQIKS